MASRMSARRSRTVWAAAILAALAVLVVTAAALVSVRPAPPLTSEQAQADDPLWTVYFTEPIYPDRPANRHGGLDEKLVTFLNTAVASIDVAIYQLDLPNATQALLDAEKRGVQVRLVTDIDTLDDRRQNGAFAALQAAGIAVVGGNPKGIMHDKFAVVDGAAVWTGSWNFTTNDAYRYNNNAIIVRSAMLAQRYTLAFNRMFVEQRFGAAKAPANAALRFSTGSIGVESYFSIEDRPVEAIIARVQQARSSVYFLAYTFTHDGIGQAVRAAAQRGVAVHGVFESNAAKEPAGEWSPMKAMALDVRLDGNRYLMHHKVFVIDETTVIMGSFNFTENAEHDNDENMLVIDDPMLARAYIAEFQKVYAHASQ